MDVNSFVHLLLIDRKVLFSSLSFLFSLACYVPYVKSVLTDKDIHPTLSSWLSWLATDIAVLAGIMAAGEMAWQMVAYILGCLFVIAASVYRGAAVGWTRFDSICFGIVIVACLLWYLSGDPNVGIVTNIVAVLFGTTPVLRNLWRDPKREPFLSWILVGIGGMFGALAVPEWNIAGALAPVVYLVLQVLIILLICRKFLMADAQPIVEE